MQTTSTPPETQQHATTETASNQERKYFRIYPDMGFSSAPLLVWVNEQQVRVGFPGNPPRQNSCRLKFLEPFKFEITK